MPDSIAPVVPVLLGLAMVWAGAAVVLHAAGRMRGRDASWEVFVGFGLWVVGPVLPELGIAIGVAASGTSATDAGAALVVGTVLGSLLSRATLVLGLGALLGAAAATELDGSTRPPLILLAILLVAGLAFDGSLGRIDGGVLLAFGLVQLGRRVRTEMRGPDVPQVRYGLLPDPFLLVVGLGVVAAAGWLLAPRAASLAEAWGAAPMLVGLLVLGLGASLPELVLGLDAATRGRNEMSASSVLGSGTLGLLAPLGVAAVIRPVPVNPLALRLDLPALGVIASALWLLDRRAIPLSRGPGGLLVTGFLVYAGIRIVLS